LLRERSNWQTMISAVIASSQLMLQMSIRQSSLPDQHGLLCSFSIWHNLHENEMINPAFRRPDNAPSERPTPVAPASNICLKFRITLRNFFARG
jgi:phage tail sheath protein FI